MKFQKPGPKPTDVQKHLQQFPLYTALLALEQDLQTNWGYQRGNAPKVEAGAEPRRNMKQAAPVISNSEQIMGLKDPKNVLG